MTTAILRFAIPLAAALVFDSGARAADYLIRDGDRVVFLGDSITEQRLYTTYIEGYTLTRYPHWDITFRNVGWGGDTSWLRQRAHPDEKALFAADPEQQQSMVNDAVKRGLDRDVLPLQPTVVTIKFGMNDHSYQPFREDIFRAYVRSQERLVRVLQGVGARVALLTPQPIEDKRPDPDKDARNLSLRKFSDGLKDVAGKTGAAYVDQFDPYLGLMMRERAADPAAVIGGGDAVHPGPAGQTLMAWAVLKGLGAGAVVSRLEIDGGAQKVTSAERCAADNLKLSEGALSFDRLDEALPMPIDPRAKAALQLAPILDELSRYELRVTGLAAEAYEVRIDGEVVGTVSRDALAKGWNLAGDAGPVTRQSQSVLDLVFKKNDVFFRRWREVQLMSLPNWARNPVSEAGRRAEIAGLDRQIAELEQQIAMARQPQRRHFVLTPAGR